jgi:hypothetical protein
MNRKLFKFFNCSSQFFFITMDPLLLFKANKEFYTCQQKQKDLSSAYKDLAGVDRAGDHLFPFRTEKLSPAPPMVLGSNPGE